MQDPRGGSTRRKLGAVRFLRGMRSPSTASGGVEGRDYVEMDVPNDRIRQVFNPITRIDELQIVGDVPHGPTSAVVRRR